MLDSGKNIMSREIKIIDGVGECVGESQYATNSRIAVTSYCGQGGFPMVQLTLMNSLGYLQLDEQKAIDLAEAILEAFGYEYRF